MKDNVKSEGRRAENLARTLKPEIVAVVGATNALEKAGAQAMLALAGFPGTVYPVNPKAQEVMGQRCYPTLAALPEAPDLVILAVPSGLAPHVAEDAALAKAGGLLVIAGGFAETGEDGRALQEALLASCLAADIRLLGPNTSGFINPKRGCVASFAPGLDQIAAGPVGVVAQSGGVNLTIALLLHRLGHGVSHAVGLGNSADVGTVELIEFLMNDPDTKSIALHLEGVTDGRALFQAVARATRKKPVVVFPVGQEDVGDFALSHTGKMMGAHQTTVAAMRQAGALVVDGAEALVLAATALAHRRLPPLAKPGVAVITGQAGPGLIIADRLKAAGVDVPPLAPETVTSLNGLLPPLTYLANPVDTGRPGDSFGAVVETVLADAAIDAAVIYALDEPSALDAKVVLGRVLEKHDTPILFASLGTRDMGAEHAALSAQGIFSAGSPDALADGLIALVRDAEAQHRLLSAQDEAFAASKAETLSSTPDEAEAKELLAAYGVATPARVVCETGAQAHAALETLGGPVVVKVLDSTILHKSDAGGVHLGVRDAAGLDAALEAIDAIPDLGASRRYLVEAMWQFDTEMIVGAVRDPSWGVCLSVGSGGVLTELLADTATCLAPVGRDALRERVMSLRGAALLTGFRGGAPGDVDGVIDALNSLQQIMFDHPEIAEIEINPLAVRADGVAALDALITCTQSNAE